MLNSVIHITENKLPTVLKNMPVVLYGGGSAGKLILDLLIQNGIQIMYIVDDSVNLHDSYIKQVKVITYAEFCEYSENHEKVAVIMATIYGKAVLNKMSFMDNVQVYELYDWFLELNGDRKWLDEMFADTVNIQKMKAELEALRGIWADEESEAVLDGVMDYIKTRDLNVISPICSADDHYFIPEIIKVINFPLMIIDGGACRGELLDTLQKNKLDYDRCYFFETDSENFKILIEKRRRTVGNSKSALIEVYGVKKTKLFFVEGTDCASGKIVNYETSQAVETITINEYFENTKCNYIKMDIEGAEYEALVGGMQVIKRDRPILAISIYHSLEDLWRIPKYLISELINYEFYVRQHALIYGEIVLYGIPSEL